MTEITCVCGHFYQEIRPAIGEALRVPLFRQIAQEDLCPVCQKRFERGEELDSTHVKEPTLYLRQVRDYEYNSRHPMGENPSN